MTEMSFTPALGRTGLSGAYDLAIRLLTRERVWRNALLEQVGPRAGEAIVDVGCGTGTFAIMLKQASPRARIVGLDPDPDILAIAAAKAAAAGVEIEWRQGFANEAADLGTMFDKAVSSLVFHQAPLPMKRAGIYAMAAAVGPGGEVHIADYARQSSGLMRRLFRMTVQRIDGLTDTQLNADGALETIIGGFDVSAAQPTRIVPTPTGAISLFRHVSASGPVRVTSGDAT
jgi:ubiquinone/menaquinone biosynthesis C-methylase UbiE